MFGYVKYFPYLCTIFFTTKLKKKWATKKLRL